MTTQTLRGLATHGGMHWRGDRVTGFFGVDACTEPTGAPCDEDLSFRNFIVAFEGLLGKHGTVTPTQMQQFADFTLQLMLPPNPVRNLDNSLTAAQTSGQTLFNVGITDTVDTCNGCHTLNPAQGFFGSGGRAELRGRAAERQGPAPAQRLHQGRHVRPARRSPARRPGPRLRLPARRRRRQR